MDSLLATYASSDEEDDQPTQNQPIQFQSQPPSKFGGNLFSNLPPPSSSSKPDKFLPQPKSERSDPFSVNPKPRKVVQFRPPVISKVEDDDDDDDDDDDNKVILKTTDDYVPQAPSVKSFLSSIPAPRNSGSLGAGAASSAGAGRRSILEAQVQGVSSSNVVEESADKSSDDKVKNDHNVSAAVDNSFHEYAAATVDNASYDGYDYREYQNVETDNTSCGPVAAAASVDNSSYGGYEGYGEYGIHGQYESKWIDRSSGSLEPEIPLLQSHGKRGRNEIPAQVIEVNQDELMKNRPRQDQVKLTGIAFGPSYQPVSSAKGKPSKLHKRKHQIGTLYFDMRSKEAELVERRSKGFLTKAQTQAKYGW